MTDHRPNGEPDVAEVSRLLREEARQHRPDIDLIMQRVDQARREPQRSLTRTGPLAVAGAAAALIVAVVTFGRPWGTHPTAPAVPVATTPPSVPVASTWSPAAPSSVSAAPPRSSVTSPSGTSTPNGAASASAGTTSPTPTVSVARTASPAAGTTPAAQTTAAPTAPGVTVSGLATGSTVALPRGGDRDWVVVGARRDGAVVRAKAGTGEIASVGPQGGAAAVSSGPLRVSWSGGLPEQTHVDAATWWVLPHTGAGAGAGTGFRVTVRPVRAGRIDLYVGSTGTPLRLTVTRTTAGGQASTPVTVPAGPAALVGVDVRDTTAGEVVEVWLAAGGSGGGPAIAAVAVR